MEIKKNKEGTHLTLALTGKLDTLTAPELEAVVKTELDGVTDLYFDLSGLEYISSAGLRVLLTAQKVMNVQGYMTVLNPNEIVREVFEVTGFSDIFTVDFV